MSRTVARMALQWKGRVACKWDRRGTMGLLGVEKHVEVEQTSRE